MMPRAAARLDHGALERIDQVSVPKMLRFRTRSDRHAPEHMQLAKQFPAPVAKAHIAAAKLDESIGSEPQGQPEKFVAVEQAAVAVDSKQGIPMQRGLRFEDGLN